MTTTLAGTPNATTYLSMSVTLPREAGSGLWSLAGGSMAGKNDYFAPVKTYQSSHQGSILFVEVLTAAGLGFWGFVVGANAAAKVALTVGLPVLVGAIWWLFTRSGARFKLPLLGATAI